MSFIISGDTGATFPDSSLQGAAASPYVLKNRIINGAMVIDQRNAGASVATTTAGSGTYTLDRWQYYASQTSKFTVQQNAGSVTPPTGFNNYLGCTSSSAYSVLSTELFLIRQAIEGFNASDLAWGTANAKTVTLSFQVYSSLTGTFGGAIYNYLGTRSYPFSYTISSANTWTQISITIAGDTSASWTSGGSSSNTNSGWGYITFNLGCGSAVSGTTGVWNSGNAFGPTGATSIVGTNGATWYITGVQLEIGTSATPFERRLYSQELANCQRYYEVFYGDTSGLALTSTLYTTSPLSYYTWIWYKVPKRASTTFSVVGTGAWNGTTPTIYTGTTHSVFQQTANYYITATSNTMAFSYSAEL